MLDRLTARDLPATVGRYRLRRLLGEGGMARVFAAEDVAGGDPFALKVVRAHLADDRMRASLLREAKLGGLLNHPNIVQTRGVVDVDGQPAIVLELVDGPSLEELLERGPLSPQDAIAVARGIAAALTHAHTAHEGGESIQLIHRDLKPANVLLDAGGRVLVSDFGIAKANNVVSTTATGMTKGTPLYMSPEQLEGATLDARSDLFAFGAILWELLVGERLHRGDSLPAVVMSTSGWRRRAPWTPSISGCPARARSWPAACAAAATSATAPRPRWRGCWASWRLGCRRRTCRARCSVGASWPGR